MDFVEITGCCYGIKQANHEFDKDLVNVLIAAGFAPTPSDHHSFHKRCPINPTDSLTLNMHVDDGWYVTCSQTLRDELKNTLQHRYGTITFNGESSGVCGVRLTRNPDHSCTLDQPYSQIPPSVWNGPSASCTHTFYPYFLWSTNWSDPCRPH